ncbi:hypothetical protein [Brachybacterium kimchii]|uniref:SGNH hydrolase-type esterase domain-containing protein n=1 Tax=Brachybacterium kimchii TaxID=2942909 RepID=A0ABY4N424_9MICO|nr:hypothetical protein [Brachybacterium kimchii]UQN28069.1 hypothetical protein M4486_10425 [Brachybacterium kimchii]
MTASPLPVYYLGDSHVRYFKKAAKAGLLAPHELTGVEVGGATAVGMRNPNSKTDAIGRFRKWISDRSREAIVVFHLGEVDCGYVIWYRADKYDEPVELQMENSVEAYFEFIDELRGLGFRRIIITGATLPTITDDDQVGEVVVKRSAITATQKQRTDLTLRYNEMLRREAVRRGLPYVDIDEDVLDSKTGVVDERMRNPNPEDHHMHGSVAAVLWARKLRDAVATYQETAPAPRIWTCTHATYLKAYPGHSQRMPVDMRHAVSVGDVVTGDEVQTQGQYTVIRNARINGTSYPLMGLLHTEHYGPATPPESDAAGGLLGLLQRILRRRPNGSPRGAHAH